MDSNTEKVNPLAKKLAKILDNQLENDKANIFRDQKVLYDLILYSCSKYRKH